MSPSDPAFDAAQAIEIRQEIVLALIARGLDASQIERDAAHLVRFVMGGADKARAAERALNLADALVKMIDQNMVTGQGALNLAEAYKSARRQGAA